MVKYLKQYQILFNKAKTDLTAAEKMGSGIILSNKKSPLKGAFFIIKSDKDLLRKWSCQIINICFLI